MVRSICFDSRQVRAGALFVAIRGACADGHAYIAQATAAGCTVVVCERLPTQTVPQVTYVVVDNSALALGMIANDFYGRPSAQLRLVAVTGTNGKSSTVHLLAGLFRQLGYRVGMLSTICNQIDGQTLPATHTTPDAVQTNALLARMVARGCQYCFMEASSHAIVQHRMAGLELAGAVFLNVTHEHLDYHGTFEAYIQAKKQLFDGLPAGAFALVNLDDRRGPVMVQNTRAAVHSFALKTPAPFAAKLLSNTLQGLELRIDEQSAWFQLIGTFNAYNLLAAYAVARLLGIECQAALTALSALRPVAGRFQRLHAPAGFEAIVDYAHTPDALQNVLATISHVKVPSGRIITVVGCGGNRDRQKRPLMAQAAWRHSHRVILTSDNPRSETPEAIIQDMLQGLRPAQRRNTLAIVDRAEAIKAACQLAQAQDVVLIAGKGHETYQEVQGRRLPFDDRAVLQQLFT